MWGPVTRALVARCKTDTTLTTLLGGQHIYRNRTRTDIQIPSVAWSVLYSGVEENHAPVSVQIDVWAHGAEALEAIEVRLYQLLHDDLPQDFDGLLMWCQYGTRFDMHDAAEGVAHSAMEFRFTPARENG
jgi:hypothetical protein